MDIIQSQKSRGLYPILVVAGVAVTIFSALGIAAITGHIPLAHSSTAPDTARKNSPPRICSHCGVVSSIQAVETEGKATGLGAVAGGVAGALIGNQMGSGNGRTAMTVFGAAGGGYLGNRIERNARSQLTYKVVVHMDDGTLRIIRLTHTPEIAVGERVQVTNGRLSPLN